MKNKIRYELFVTEKYALDYAYVSNMTSDDKEEVSMYRAELVRLLTSEIIPLNIPPRPPVFDRYN